MAITVREGVLGVNKIGLHSFLLEEGLWDVPQVFSSRHTIQGIHVCSKTAVFLKKGVGCPTLPGIDSNIKSLMTGIEIFTRPGMRRLCPGGGSNADGCGTSHRY